MIESNVQGEPFVQVPRLTWDGLRAQNDAYAAEIKRLRAAIDDMNRLTEPNATRALVLTTPTE